jgi:hypothetical protein
VKREMREKPLITDVPLTGAPLDCVHQQSTNVTVEQELERQPLTYKKKAIARVMS